MKGVADWEGIVADLEVSASEPDDLEGRVLAVARRAEMAPDVKEVVTETDVAEVMTLDVEEVTETDVEEVTTPGVEAAAWDGIVAALAAWEGNEKGGVWRRSAREREEAENDTEPLLREAPEAQHEDRDGVGRMIHVLVGREATQSALLSTHAAVATGEEDHFVSCSAEEKEEQSQRSKNYSTESIRVAALALLETRVLAEAAGIGNDWRDADSQQLRTGSDVGRTPK